MFRLSPDTFQSRTSLQLMHSACFGASAGFRAASAAAPIATAIVSMPAMIIPDVWLDFFRSVSISETRGPTASMLAFLKILLDALISEMQEPAIQFAVFNICNNILIFIPVLSPLIPGGRELKKAAEEMLPGFTLACLLCCFQNLCRIHSEYKPLTESAIVSATLFHGCQFCEICGPV